VPENASYKTAFSCVNILICFFTSAQRKYGLRYHGYSDRPWGPPRLPYNGYRVLHGGKAGGRGVDHPPQPRAGVKERVDLCL
jgi:hypothetical protein